MDAKALAILTEAFFKVEAAKLKIKLAASDRFDRETRIRLELVEDEYESVLQAAFHQEEQS